MLSVCLGPDLSGRPLVSTAERGVPVRLSELPFTFSPAFAESCGFHDVIPHYRELGKAKQMESTELH